MSAQPSVSLSAPARWLANELTTLLASPHIVTPSHLGGLSLAPGPVDLFSTRFNNMFMRHARGLVGGREVDREGLKQSLLALQKHWNAKSEHRFEDIVLHHRIEGFHPEMGVRIEFMPMQSPVDLVLYCEACVAQQDGRRRIKMLMLDGDQALFKP